MTIGISRVKKNKATGSEVIYDLTPISQGTKHAYAATLNTDIFTNDITPKESPSLIRVMVMLETSGVFSAILKNSSTSKTLKMNSATALVADSAYIFDILVDSGDTLNFQTSASGNVTLRVQEIVGSVQ